MNDNREIADMVDLLARLPHIAGHGRGLTASQWSALRFLARANRFSRTVSGVAAFQATTRGTASQLIKGLEQKGFLTRTPDASDRRRAQLDLTDTGLALLDHDPLAVLSDAAGALPATEQQALAATLGRLIADVVQRGNLAVSGQCGQCTFLERAEVPVDDRTLRCGFTGEGLSVAEVGQLCVSFRASERDAEPRPRVKQAS